MKNEDAKQFKTQTSFYLNLKMKSKSDEYPCMRN